jgi:hypothetical protein
MHRGVTAYAWSLKLFIIFLEVVPVLGKLFFAPPSAYAIHLWDAISAVELARLEGHTDQVRALAVLPDGHLVFGSDDGVRRETGKE